MCGICGLASHDAAMTPQRATLEGMNNAIQHRGPDGEGYYTAAGVGMGMRRLAIIDLNTGDQPISNECGNLWIVFNGEIYNYPDLRRGLLERGHTLRTQTDTECIVHLYEEKGARCVEDLRGMFAFSIWDVENQRLFIARDRLGKKPMYYSVQDGVLYYGSELASLFAALPHKPEIDLQAIDLYLSLQYVPEPRTPYQGIYKLPAGHTLTWQRGDLRIEKYWDFSYTPVLTGSEEELAAELRERLTESVRMRLISDVPLGAHLSGGIDSSIVVALMAQLSSGPVKTFTVGFEEQAFNEAEYARSVAQRYGTDHHEFILTYQNIPQTLEIIIHRVGEPFADPSAIPLYHLSVLTRQHVTVALNGDGGDEAFAGYARYWFDPWANRYVKLPRALTRGLIPSLANLLPDSAERPVGASLVNGLKRLGTLAETDPRASILRWGSYFTPKQKSALWRVNLHEGLNLHLAQEQLTAQFEAAPAASFLGRTLYTDIKTYLPGDLLVKADRMTMAASLEGRSPFLDHTLIEWSARLPESLKVRGRMGKYLLRKAFANELPARVGARGKQGFGIPVGLWMRGELRSWAQDLIRASLRDWFDLAAVDALFNEHASSRADHGKRLWALTALAVWKDRTP